MSFFLTGILICVNLVLIIAARRARKRLPGEPPLVKHRIPLIGEALKFGQNPLQFLKDLQKKHGNVFSWNLVGWTVHAVTHPLDIAFIEKNKKLIIDVVSGEFATRLAGKHHTFFNSLADTYDITDPIHQRNKDVPKAFFSNLRGPSQLKSLFQSSVRNSVQLLKHVLEGKIEIPYEDDNGRTKFVYDRFLEKSTSDEKNQNPKIRTDFSKDGTQISASNSILTFGFGKGKCPGRHLALMEIKLMILGLLACFDPKLISDKEPKMDLMHIGFGVLVPKDKIVITL